MSKIPTHRNGNQSFNSGFHIPDLDRRTYGRLKEMRQEHSISQHGLVTLAINLLYEKLHGLDGDMSRIQEETGIHRFPVSS